jgi:transposase
LVVFVIGIDPHKGSHTAAVLDEAEHLLAELRVDADRRQRDRLLAFAEPFTPRAWAVEGAWGLGSLLSQQLVAAGEVVFDVPAGLSARVRLLDAGANDKTDAHDARSAAVVALRHRKLREVHPADHASVLRLLADRHHQLNRTRTQSVNRLHSMLCELIEGGVSQRLSADRAAKALRTIRPVTPLELERKRIAHELLAEVRRLDTQLTEVKTRIGSAVAESGTTVTAIHGVGPIVAALILGHVGDIRRFPNAAHFARYNGTAPIEASSAVKVRHRLNRKGNRRLNHALHIVALVQISSHPAGRAYYDRKRAEGKTTKEAIRALKRRISDAVYRQLAIDARR